jgi:hypothetical protein
MVFSNPKERADKISKSSIGKKCPWARGNPQVFKKGASPWNKGLINKTKHTCKNCGKEFIRNKKLAKYCSVTCSSNAQRGGKRRYSGERHHLWKGGISRYVRYEYYTPAYTEWRSRVFVRDNFTCQECGVKGATLNAHHIKSATYFPEYKFDINNGVTLCIECHKKTDNYGHRGIHK